MSFSRYLAAIGFVAAMVATFFTSNVTAHTESCSRCQTKCAEERNECVQKRAEEKKKTGRESWLVCPDCDKDCKVSCAK